MGAVQNYLVGWHNESEHPISVSRTDPQNRKAHRSRQLCRLMSDTTTQSVGRIFDGDALLRVSKLLTNDSEQEVAKIFGLRFETYLHADTHEI